MKCSSCGGEVLFKDGIAICQSCGAKHKIDHVFEDVEVYICYTESDFQGRRTKDSLIANDIYRKLEAKKINTFYERVSASDVSGGNLDALRYQAIYKSKVILIVGTQKGYFEDLISKYEENFEGKVIIPVYSEIRPENMPKDLCKLQALNYDAIGADVDLVKGILTALGKDKEYELTQLQEKAKKKKKIALIVSLCALVVVIAVAALFIVNNTNSEPPQLTSLEIYENANALMDEGKYLEAAEQFKTIVDYKDSSKQIKNIYDRYDGYYQTEDLDILFYLNIQNGETFDLLLERTLEGNKKVKAEGSSTFESNIIEVLFIDNQSNQGTMTVTLTDDGFTLKTVMDNDSAVSVGNLELQFSLEQRTDKPEEKGITKETISKWLTEKTSLTKLKEEGYEIEFSSSITSGGGINPNVQVHSIANTDIQLMMIKFDLANTYSSIEANNNPYDDFVVGAVIAPAEILCPEKIGDKCKPYTKDSFLYAPNVTEFDMTNLENKQSPEYCFTYYFDNTGTSKTIDNQTLVGMSSEYIMGKNNFNALYNEVERLSLEATALGLYLAEYDGFPEGGASAAVVAQNGGRRLICVYPVAFAQFDGFTDVGYYVSDSDMNVKLVKIFPDGGSANNFGSDLWELYPEYFGEFI